MQYSTKIFTSELFGALSSKIKTQSEAGIELKNFTVKIENHHDRLPEDLTEEIVDTLDIDNLRSILKSKLIKGSEDKNNVLNKNSNFLNLDKEKIDELENIIKLKQKEFQRNSKFQKDLKKEVKFWREKANLNEIPNEILTHENKKDKLQKTDLVCFKTYDYQFTDSDILFSSKPMDNEISKKWFFDEKIIAINFDKLTLKFEKFNKEKMNFTQKKEFHVILVEIRNSSNSTVFFNDIQIDSTESQFFLKKNIPFLNLNRFNCYVGLQSKYKSNFSSRILFIKNLCQKIPFSR